MFCYEIKFRDRKWECSKLIMTWRQQDFCRIQFFAPLLYVCRYINNMHCRCSTRVVTVKGYDPSHPGLPEAFILRWSFFKISFLICCFSEKKNIAGKVMTEFIILYNLYPHHHICNSIIGNCYFNLFGAGGSTASWFIAALSNCPFHHYLHL